MQQIAHWLDKLGMSEYAQCFAENKIDVPVLGYLTDQDLKDIGIPLGHRRRMLAAIAELVGAGSAVAGPVTAIEPRAREYTERRQVTVMFVDLVGSTELSARMDPEDLREVISAYQKCVAGTVRRFDGFVAKYMGDGVVVYFGYPEAHEDDAERAVRAGLELIAAVGALKTHTSLQTRVGIATGVVVVGDIHQSGEAQERGIVGETPNLAARLQATAEPNTVVIAEGTRRLLGDLFELDDLGTRDLKGIPGPVRLWTALRTSSVASRFEALHLPGRTALVGREEESELLLRRWARAKTGEGQVVLLSGEAGIGKSRLTAELLERLSAEPHTRLRYFCSPQHTDSALFPIIGQMQRAAGLALDDAPKTRLDKLDAVLAQTATSIEDAALIAEMLSLASDGRYPTLDLEPQQRRERTLEALNLQIEALSRSNPLLMIFEDAHWTDPTSLEALARVVDRIRSLPVLLIVTYRSEFTPPWIGLSHVTTLIINRLADRAVDAMIDRLIGDKPLPANIRQDIIERTDGIPLFVEEMTKAVLEAESESAAKSVAAMVPSSALTVPASLHASLMARLDRLGAAKEVAQIGAAMGRAFSHALLAATARKPEADLRSALDRLIQAELLFRQGQPPHATYLFKHALVRDAAYGTLLREPRQALHARIAEVLESSLAEIAERQPELLAHHCTEAGLIEKAAGLWGKAGRRSQARSALVEAAEQLNRALGQIAALPSTPTLRREEIKLQVALVKSLQNLKGFAENETKAAVERARLLIERAEALGEPTEDPRLLFSVVEGLWIANVVAFNRDVARELSAQLLALAEKQGEPVLLAMAHRAMGVSLFFAGDLAQSRDRLDRAMAFYESPQHHGLASPAGQHNRATVLSYRSVSAWLLGYPETALADSEHALDRARQLSRAATLMNTLFFGSFAPMQCGRYLAAMALADELVSLADQKGASWWKTVGVLAQGRLLAVTGKTFDAVQTITSGLTALGKGVLAPEFLSYLAKAYAELDEFDDAWRCVGEAMTLVEATKGRLFEAEVYRIAGEIALKSPDRNAAKAEAYFERALVVARGQRAKSWELRATMSMARLWRDQNKRDEARDLLAPVYGWFTEGFDTLDLKEAKTLLGALAS